MPWAKIDDGFDEHPKIESLFDEEDELMALAAIGLWTVSLSRAHREMQPSRRHKNKKPGLIQRSNIRRYTSREDREQLAGLLVKYGLWEVDPDGEGWMIHDFGEYLPSGKLKHQRSIAGQRGAATRYGRIDEDGNLLDKHGNLLPEVGNLPEESWQDMARARPRGGTPEPEPKETIKNSSPSAPPMGDSDDGALPGLAPPPAVTRRRGVAVTGDSPDFVRFWEAYPKRKGKVDARKAWAKAIKSGTDPDSLISAAERYAVERARLNEEEKYTLYPATWLNGERWDDEPAVTNGRAGAEHVPFWEA